VFERAFDLDEQFRYVDDIFDRVFDAQSSGAQQPALATGQRA
jgi:hypothetical protein